MDILECAECGKRFQEGDTLHFKSIPYVAEMEDEMIGIEPYCKGCCEVFVITLSAN